MSEKSRYNQIPTSVIGVLAPIAYSNISRVLGLWESPWMLVVLVAIYVGIGAYIWQETFKRTWRHFFVIILLIPVGIFIDANIDFFIRNFDRNLFPFEIVILWIITPVLLLFGMGLRKLIKL